ncbi:MAG: 50S ribosomal protein L3 [Candidatus Parvarchaeota archaeon]|nr:50S ribosomal protein L3 [Candidatus Parvarchaeota archaeon]MCW1301540.1 50S ribosomal protein L3 [Candidatus Parvarchaeota archaeon]
MGHQITKKSTPRRGSLQYYPIKKSQRPFHRLESHVTLEDGELSLFAGYKAGMRQAIYVDNDKDSPTFKTEIISPVTIIETPPLLVAAARFYKDGKSIGDVWTEADKNIERRVKYKPNNADFDELSKKASDARLIVSTMPWKIGLKKTPELFEVDIGGDINKKLEKIKSLMGKEINASEFIKEGTFVDVGAVTKGKGFSGSVKRFGVKIYPVHASKSRRKAGNLGAESMAKVQFTVPQHGRLGFNSRTEYNKFVLKVLNDPMEANIPQGYYRYGNLNAPAMVLKGSVPGSPSRLIMIRKAIRPNKKLGPTKVTLI